MNYEIDNLDKQILRLLMQDVTRAYTDIAKELNVSGGTIHVRMKKLNEMVSQAPFAVSTLVYGWRAVTLSTKNRRTGWVMTQSVSEAEALSRMYSFITAVCMYTDATARAPATTPLVVTNVLR